MSDRIGVYKGLLAVFEGIDGAGKQDAARELQRHIQERSKYIDVIMTHEPWKSSEIKKKLERDNDAYSDGELMAELFVEDRVKHTHRLLRPVLSTGGIVLSDRYKMSTCAYQWAQGVDLHRLLELHDNKGILIPDITFLLDVTRETAEKRRGIRAQRTEKYENQAAFVDKLIEAYRSLGHMAQVDERLFGKVVLIDGNKSREEVATDIRAAFDPYLSRWLSQDDSHAKTISIREQGVETRDSSQ